MFQVEQRFERQMINFGEKDRPIRHYPIAEVVAGHLVLHIIGTQPIQEPDGHVYKRRTHLMGFVAQSQSAELVTSRHE